MAERPRTVLYIEDQPVNARLLSDIVNFLWGWSVDVRASAEEGIEQLSRKDYDLIYLDVNLPGLSGYDAARRIRELARGRNTPIIAVTADATSRARTNALDAGCNGYITKPLDIAKFKTLTEHLLGDEGE